MKWPSWRRRKPVTTFSPSYPKWKPIQPLPYPTKLFRKADFLATGIQLSELKFQRDLWFEADKYIEEHQDISGANINALFLQRIIVGNLECFATKGIFPLKDKRFMQPHILAIRGEEYWWG